MRHFLLYICTLFSSLLLAQTTLKGTVMDATNGETLIGASVKVKSAATDAAVTDYDGAFILKTSQPLPLTLVVTYIGYADKEIEVANATPLTIKMGENARDLVVVEIIGQRVSDKQKAAPLTVEQLDLIAMKQTSASSIYNGLGALPSVDLTTASLGFTIINTRGFNSTSPVRSLQIIDGVDNQAPGLNFSLGNFLGSSELDLMKVDLIVGASSAFYGPNAFNGVISMETKNPFYQKGLSVMLKGGERNMLETAIRYGNSVTNKNGNEFLAFKFNLSYLRADDWVADNYDAVGGTRTQNGNPGRWDAVNTYGDEYFPLNNKTGDNPWSSKYLLGIFHRTGYAESDVVDYNTRNVKANVALHIRTKPTKGFESPEVVISSSYGNGTTVYQGDNRFSLRGIQFFQNRIEFRKRDKFFIRAYATNENAGRSYDPYFTALRMQQLSKSNKDWSEVYTNYWGASGFTNRAREMGYPNIVTTVIPDPPYVVSSFDDAAAAAWLANQQNLDSLAAWHAITQQYANTATGFLVPGTPAFQSAFDSLTNLKSNDREGGTAFYDKSSLYHLHGEYRFTPSWAKYIAVGANTRLYRPVSDGTIFRDTNGVTIRNSEFGLYSGIEKHLDDDHWILNGTLRADKNQNFGLLFTPAASVVWHPIKNHYFRFSGSSAIRNPTLSDQYLNLNVGPAKLVGNLNGFKDMITIESFIEYLDSTRISKLKYTDVDAIRPEKVKTLEVGYRTTIGDHLYADLSYYFSFYNDFIGYQIGVTADFDSLVGTASNVQIYRVAANANKQVTTQGFTSSLTYYFSTYYSLNGNYSWNRLNTATDDPIVPAFNTPEHKFNIGISGRDVPLFGLKKTGFNINYKWIDAFVFEGSPQFTGQIPTYSLLDAQWNVNLEKIHTTIKLGASNILNNERFQTYGGPRIGRMGYISFVYDFQDK